MPSRLRRLNQAGDTIVEVLIAVLVLSTILAGAYQVASRATKENIQTQEHSQALQVAQGQLEILKSQPSNPTASPFCFSISTPNTAAPLTGDPAQLNSTSYPSECQQALAGGSCAAGNTCFFVAVTRGYSSDPDLYTATVRWDGINGGTDQVSLTYRLTP